MGLTGLFNSKLVKSPETDSSSFYWIFVLLSVNVTHSLLKFY
jgi:hypothetical protein